MNARSPSGPGGSRNHQWRAFLEDAYQEFEFLKIYGLDMEPDVVVLGYVFNDVYHKYLQNQTSSTFIGGDPAAHLYDINRTVSLGSSLLKATSR